MKSQFNRDVIFVSNFKTLSQQFYYRRLWLAAKNLGIPRRHWLDEIANCFRDYQGIICYPDGEPFIIPDIDETFGNDSSARWLGYYLASDKSGNCPRLKSRKMKRLQLIDLYFKIRHPRIADHFGR